MRRKTRERFGRLESRFSVVCDQVVMLERKADRPSTLTVVGAVKEDSLRALEVRVRQLECPHEHVKFMVNAGVQLPYVFRDTSIQPRYGWKVCSDCGKALESFDSCQDFLRAKLAHAKANHKADVAAIEAELAKASG